jgi:hypothetical protein
MSDMYGPLQISQDSQGGCMWLIDNLDEKVEGISDPVDCHLSSICYHGRVVGSLVG